MKKFILILLGICSISLLHAQSQASRPVLVNKIILTNGQKIIVQNSVSIESSMSPGMDVTSSTTSENTLEVKNATEKNYTISNSLTKVKLNMEMMGQSNSYDSEKKEDQNTEIGKSFAAKLNKPSDVVIDNSTGLVLSAKKPEKKTQADEGNPMQGLLQMFGETNDDAIVTGAFELIPEGKNPGDSWKDSTLEKDTKIWRTYTLKSYSDSGAVIQLNTVIDATTTIEMQGMSMDLNSNTQTSSEILTDKVTGLVKKRTTTANVSGSFQVMGQSVPITAKATTTTTYK